MTIVATETFLDETQDDRQKVSMTIALGNAIKAARLRAKLTQLQLAGKLSISRAAVGQWEAGTNEPTLSNLRKLSALLEADLVKASNENIVQERRAYYQIPEDHDVFTPANNFDFPITLSAGNDDGQVFHMQEGSVWFYVRRFEFFSQINGIKAMLFTTDVLSPRYEKNDVVYIDPNKRPQAGDYATLRFASGIIEGRTNYTIVRRILFIDDRRVIMDRLRPAVQEEWPLDSFAEIGTLIREYELVRKR